MEIDKSKITKPSQKSNFKSQNIESAELEISSSRQDFASAERTHGRASGTSGPTHGRLTKPSAAAAKSESESAKQKQPATAVATTHLAVTAAAQLAARILARIPEPEPTVILSTAPELEAAKLPALPASAARLPESEPQPRTVRTHGAGCAEGRLPTVAVSGSSGICSRVSAIASVPGTANADAGVLHGAAGNGAAVLWSDARNDGDKYGEHGEYGGKTKLWVSEPASGRILLPAVTISRTTESPASEPSESRLPGGASKLHDSSVSAAAEVTINDTIWCSRKYCTEYESAK